MSRVTIKQGELEGSIKVLKSAKTYASFKGIPYAMPPIGDLRFKAPQPPLSWTGVRDATKHGPISPQWDMAIGKIIEGDEDCLFLNVYTPDIRMPVFPVMVYFHGGGFQSGSGNSDMYGPDYLLEEDVILVTVNFRLEALGLLCLDTEEVPGNAAMKDQVMALKWINENISSFGGDPENVTIFGESSGGVATTHHMISPMSKGLFHKVIAQSACIFNYWGITYDSIDRAFRLGKFLGLETSDKDELLKYLRDLPAKAMCKVNYEILTEFEKNCGVPIYFCPVIEKHFDGQEPFLSKSPAELISDGDFPKIPLLLGYNSAEGIVFYNNTVKRLDLLNEDFTRKLPRDIFRLPASKAADINKISDESRRFYFGHDKPITAEDMEAIIKLDSDNDFVVGIQKLAKTMAVASDLPVYLYRFSFDGELNHTKRNYLKNGTVNGACHVDDLFYLFKTWMNVDVGTDSWKTMKRMTKMWTNFAKFGNPTPVIDELITEKWKPVTKNEMHYMDIGKELKCGVNPDGERMTFWKNVYDRLSSNEIIKFP